MTQEQKIFPLLGIDIGGTKVAVCLGTNEGDIIDSIRINNHDRSASDVIPEIIDACEKLMDQYKNLGTVRAIGIGSPGPINIAEGMIVNPYNLPFWRNIPIRKIIQDHFTQIPVFFDNDANTAAIAEWLFGSGKGCTDIIYLSLSTGIGGGIIANNMPLRGSTGDGAEVHVSLNPNGPVYCSCGMKGCYEGYCGGKAIARRIQTELKDQPDSYMMKLVEGKVEDINMFTLEKAVRDQDPYALAIWDEMCMHNAQMIGGLITIFNPQMIVLGTLANATGDLFMQPVLKYLPEYVPYGKVTAKITTSALGRNIGELSGIALALWELTAQQK